MDLSLARKCRLGGIHELFQELFVRDKINGRVISEAWRPPGTSRCPWCSSGTPAAERGSKGRASPPAAASPPKPGSTVRRRLFAIALGLRRRIGQVCFHWGHDDVRGRVGRKPVGRRWPRRRLQPVGNRRHR